MYSAQVTKFIKFIKFIKKKCCCTPLYKPYKLSTLQTVCCTHHRYLTFWHWSGVTPYTSSYEFAGSCVFGKQLPGILSLRPAPVLGYRRFQYLKTGAGKPYSEVTAAFLPSSLGKNHSFALVFSTRLPVSVCGTVPPRLCLEVFLGSLLCFISFPRTERIFALVGIAIKSRYRIFLETFLRARTQIQ